MPNVPVKGADGGTYQLEYVTGPAGGLVPVREPTFAAALGEGGITATTASAALKTATPGRAYIEISNAGSAGVWVHFGASAATAGQGSYLPAKSSNVWAYSGEVRVIVESGGASGPVGYVEW